MSNNLRLRHNDAVCSLKGKSRILWLAFLFVGLGTASLFGQTVQLCAWDFTAKGGQSSVPTSSVASGISTTSPSAVASLGAGLTVANYLSNGLTATQQTQTTLAAAITGNDYITFTITPASGKSVSITDIKLRPVSQNRSRSFALFSSKNGFAAANVINTISGNGNNNLPLQTIAITGHTAITTATEFRVYIYGYTDSYEAAGMGNRQGGLSENDLILNGTVQNTSDTQAPTVPTGLASSGITQTSFTLNWTASSDNVGVTSYDVYKNGVLYGNTSATSLNMSSLTAATTYAMTVKANDAAGNVSLPASLDVTTSPGGTVGDVPKLPIGMNIPGLAYYTTSLVFTDGMKLSGEFMSWYDGGGFSSETISEIPRDADGYPTQIPYLTSDGKQSKVRVMLNSYYNGRHVLTFDGAGTIELGGITNQKVSSNKYYIDFNGSGSNAWLNIVASTNGNHLKNFKILPLQYENSSTYPTFNPKFLDGLRPFHAFRFMDWINTNNSTQVVWADRITKTHYSQATNRGASYEYAIELCNELDADAWVTIPHQADDNFITQTARLWRDGLRANRKVYAEYSNEIWNWQFTQAGYCLQNAPNHPNAYVSAGLNAISAPGNDHPEKDAYMIARTLRLWQAEFTGANATRLVRVAGVQHGWMDNTRRILNYLFDVDRAGCDVVSPGGYFNFGETDHNGWLARCGTANPVTPAEVCQGASIAYDTNERLWTDKTAEYVNARGLGYVVYEGGQHMQPYMQGDWCYNQAVWDAQINPKMYDLYMKNFRKMTEPAVNCTLFMAFAYMGQRQSKYGSWGHLESLDQIGSVSNYMTIAPKYQALLDANTAKVDLRRAVAYTEKSKTELIIYPNPAADNLSVDFGSQVEKASISIFDLQGRHMINKSAANTQIENLDVSSLSSGIYFIKITQGDNNFNSKFVKQ